MGIQKVECDLETYIRGSKSSNGRPISRPNFPNPANGYQIALREMNERDIYLDRHIKRLAIR